MIQVPVCGIGGEHIQLSVHLQAETVVPHNNERSKGSGEAKYIAAQDDLAKGTAFADGADEERNSYTPDHPVSPVENSPGLREG